MIQFYRELKLSCLEGSWCKLKEKILICAPPELFSWPLALSVSAPNFPMDIYSFLCWIQFFDTFCSLSVCLWRGEDRQASQLFLLSSFVFFHTTWFSWRVKATTGNYNKRKKAKIESKFVPLVQELALSQKLYHSWGAYPGYPHGYSQILIPFLPSIDLYKFPRGSGAVTWIPLISSKGVWGWELPASTLRRLNS